MDPHVFQQKRKKYRVLTRQYIRVMRKAERAISSGLPHMSSYFMALADALRVELDDIQTELDIEKFTFDTT